jgi:hypothetical protein
MGLPENNNKSNVEYINTQQDLPDKNKIRLDMQGFLAVWFVLPKRLGVDPYFQILAPIIVC